MSQFRDFQAAVVVDGVELPEYTIQVSEEDDEISCYIPSEVGKNFAVRWRDLKLQRNTIGTVYLDGDKAGIRAITKDTHSHEALRFYYRLTREIVRPFCFAHLSLTDDENWANRAENNLGEVRVPLDELLSYKLVPCPLDWKRNQVPGVVRIHEHSKKAMKHCVGYGDDTKQVSEEMSTDIVRGKRLATFIFRYRPLDMLQAQGIAPPPQPAPSRSTPREKKRQRCKEEDIIEVIDDGEADKARLKMLKAEISEIEVRLRKRPKPMVKSEDKTPVMANEVIELE